MASNPKRLLRRLSSFLKSSSPVQKEDKEESAFQLAEEQQAHLQQVRNCFNTTADDPARTQGITSCAEMW